MCDTRGVKANAAPSSYTRHRYPAEIIAHTVWLYFRFSLSFRDVEELMAARGVILSYETVGRWTLTFGQQYANDLRPRRPQLGDKWHIDEVFLTIHGETAYLCRAGDHHGNVLDIPVQSRRSKAGAKQFFRRLLMGCQYVPHVFITDKLASSGAAYRGSCGASSTGSTNG